MCHIVAKLLNRKVQKNGGVSGTAMAAAQTGAAGHPTPLCDKQGLSQPHHAKVSSCQGLIMPRSHHAKASSCQGLIMPRSHHAKASSCQGLIMPRPHHAKASSCQGLIMPRPHHAKASSCRGLIMPRPHHAKASSCQGLSQPHHAKHWCALRARCCTFLHTRSARACVPCAPAPKCRSTRGTCAGIHTPTAHLCVREHAPSLHASTHIRIFTCTHTHTRVHVRGHRWQAPDMPGSSFPGAGPDPQGRGSFLGNASLPSSPGNAYSPGTAPHMTEVGWGVGNGSLRRQASMSIGQQVKVPAVCVSAWVWVRGCVCAAGGLAAALPC